MSIATKIEIDQLVATYGEDVRALRQPGISCFHNGLRAAIGIFVSSEYQQLPTIWRYGKGLTIHAYLVMESIVFNRGVTWANGRYPDVDLQELVRNGRDVTAITIRQALSELQTDPTYNIIFAGIVKETTLKSTEIEEVLKRALLMSAKI